MTNQRSMAGADHHFTRTLDAGPACRELACAEPVEAVEQSIVEDPPWRAAFDYVCGFSVTSFRRSILPYAADGTISRSIRRAFLISATRRSYAAWRLSHE